jgi:hypothetical protein
MNCKYYKPVLQYVSHYAHMLTLIVLDNKWIVVITCQGQHFSLPINIFADMLALIVLGSKQINCRYGNPVLQYAITLLIC